MELEIGAFTSLARKREREKERERETISLLCTISPSTLALLTATKSVKK